ncbi:hypothetical protein [Microbulbifer aggregans]|uniref:hypothetical protein n=1 Tax=Microbulbifer aggregans TaxID=1769779 RepID=UPI001CFF4A76|nr:hypothetical protein [Microbulbifer aggregans]
MAWFGINNENEFYSEHYLSEIFSKDIQERITAWKEREDSAAAGKAEEGEPEHEDVQSLEASGTRAPYNQLRTLSRDALQFFKEAEQEKTPEERLRLQRRWTAELLAVFGWEQKPQRYSVDDDIEVPLLAQVTDGQAAPLLWVLEALPTGATDDDPLSEEVHPKQLESLNAAPLPKAMKKQDWQHLLAGSVFSQARPPRWVILVSGRQWLLLDRTKFAQGRLLRFDWLELFTRREIETLKAVSVLLHRESLLGEQGQCLLDTLDENAHKHAYGVSEDLKYALRESIELLGNEAARQLIQRREIGYTGKSALDPDQLSVECLRYMYRLLFLFYIEARPELGYAPVDNPVYLSGYSLESLRELEMVPLTSEREQNGRYFNDSLQTLFRLIQKGYQPDTHDDLLATTADGFSLYALQSHLFDPERTRLLNKVVFPNHLLQRVIKLMSLSRPGKGRKRRGRISYAQLGINQLGAVYEALLSYRGFFATEDLYEVKKAGETPDELDTGYFVNAQDLEQYNDGEKVYDTNAQGQKELRVHRKGTFIYRLAGRDREKSASYYTPEVLTQSLVKYALKELFKEQLDPLRDDDARAKRILELRVCEPAMGSAAFLNEAIDQLADKYLELAQSARNERIPQSRYLQEKQKVKMFLADNNVFGVDLNPIAVELAEVSLWLNALSADRFIPWLGLQLNCGNSLIGARREVFPVSSLMLKPSDGASWLKTAPKRVPLGEARGEQQIWHFLLPDSGMANYTEKVVKARYKADIKVINDWRKAFAKAFATDDIQRMQRLSEKIDELWNEHTESLKKLREKTTDPYQIYGFEHSGQRTSINFKDEALSGELLSEKLQNASAFRRLKLAMDYWCALWFWPIDQAHLLPSRDEWLFDLENLLLGDTFTAGPAGEVQDLFSQTTPVEEGKSFVDKFGVVNLKVLFEHFPRLRLADGIARTQRFFHWELVFADVFSDSGGFDLMLGNPPWLKVEWKEGGVLGDHQPLFALRNFSASRLNTLRDELFSRVPNVEQAWVEEYQQNEGTQNFLNSMMNFPELRGVQATLHKCFLPRAWFNGNEKSVTAFLYESGVFNDPKGAALRRACFRRLRKNFTYFRAMSLFNIQGNNKTDFHCSIFGGVVASPKFEMIDYLKHPKEIDLAYSGREESEFDYHMVSGVGENLGGETAPRAVSSNLSSGKGGASRIVVVGDDELSLFAELYDEPGTDSLEARLPSVREQQLINVLKRFSDQPRRLGDLKGQFYPLEMWHETNQQKDGTIRRETCFPKSLREWVISGPHFFVGTLFFKTPKAICTHNSHYTPLDLLDLPDDYLPRTNYVPACSYDEYMSRVPKVPWRIGEESDGGRVTDYYRFIVRKMLSQGGDRTLISTIAPREIAHIDGCTSLVFKDAVNLVLFSGCAFSLPFDFWVKTTGKANFRQELQLQMPIFDSSSGISLEIIRRALKLVCISRDYANLWDCHFAELMGGRWSLESILRDDYARRMALVEIDVLVALQLGMDLNELLSIYRSQFQQLQKYESNTWYDQNGRIVFTGNAGLVGVGLPSRPQNAELRAGISYCLKLIDGEKKEGIALGWEDIKALPAGSKVIKTFMDDTLPGGPQRRSIEYVAPFIKPDREKDYEIAWRAFEARQQQ